LFQRLQPINEHDHFALHLLLYVKHTCTRKHTIIVVQPFFFSRDSPDWADSPKWWTSLEQIFTDCSK